MADHQHKRAKNLWIRALKSRWLADSARTAVAAAASFAIARLCRLSEAYWAPLTTLIVTQSTLGAAWKVSKLRLIGTALGAAAGALMASWFSPGIITFCIAIFVLGLICAILRLDQSAYRFAGMTVAIVMLIVRTEPPWVAGIHRFIEVSIGILVGLAFSAIWPRRLL